MIKQIAQKIVTTYDNLSPRKKALADMVGITFGIIIGITVIGIVVSYGLWAELAFGLLIYSLYGMVTLLYKSRVEYYEIQEKFNK